MALQLTNIIKFYKYGKNQQIVLNNLSINFPSKGLVGIVGQSGSGKSTLLNIIAGIERPNHGQVLIDGHPLDYHQTALYQQKYISYVYQFYNLVEALTIRENLLLLANVKGNMKSNIIAKMEEYCQKLNVAGLLERYPRELSGGQQQRIGLIRAFLCNTPILLADEPTGALNEQYSIDVMKLLKNYARNHLVIVITHNQQLVENCTNMIINLDGKKNNYDFSNQRYHKYMPNKIIKQSSRLFFYTKRQLKYQVKKILMMFISQIFIILSFVLLVSAFNGGKIYLKGRFDSDPLKEIIEVSTNEYYKSFNDEQLNSFKHDKLITAAAYRLDFNGGTFKKDQVIRLEGYQIFNGKNLNYLMGHYPMQENQILINQAAATKYKLKVHDVINYEFAQINYEFEVCGILDDFINNSANVYVDQQYLSKDLAAKMTDQSVLVIQSKKVATTIKAYQKDYLLINIHQEYVDNYQAIFDLAELVVLFFIAVSFFISLILISIILKTIFIERKRDTSLLLVNGLTKIEAANLFCREAFMIGGIIGGAGSLLAMGILKVFEFTNLSEKMLKIPNLFVMPKYIYTSYDLYFLLIFIYALVCYLAGIQACWKINKMDISVLLKEN